MGELPYFRFFPSDWIGSPKVAMMDDAERGVYIGLLAAAWGFPGCCLPKDCERLRVLIRSKRRERVARVIDLCFESTPSGWRNRKETDEKLRSLDIQNKAIFASKCAANKRIASPDGRPNDRPYQIHNQKKNIRKPPANPSVRVLQDHLKSAFEKKTGALPVMSYPAIGKQLRVLLDHEKFTESALKEMIDWYMTSPKFNDHPTPAAAISADTVQRWQVACPEEPQ